MGEFEFKKRGKIEKKKTFPKRRANFQIYITRENLKNSKKLGNSKNTRKFEYNPENNNKNWNWNNLKNIGFGKNARKIELTNPAKV